MQIKRKPYKTFTREFKIEAVSLMETSELKESHMNNEMKSTTLPKEIIAAELAVIKARRKVAYATNSDQQNQLDDIDKNLRGLSISGGGIRSSAFSIGVIQSLAKANLFKDFDYVSTVSGGGYTGSMLSTLLNSKNETPLNFPLKMPVGNEEPQPLQHLRNGSNYLAPGGFLEFIRMPAVVVRGLILNFLLALPFIMAAVYLTEVIHEALPVLNIYQFITTSNHGFYLFWVIFGLICYFSLSGWRGTQGKWSSRNEYGLWLARVFLLIIAAVLFGPLTQVIDWAIQEPWHALEQRLSESSTRTTWIIGAALSLLAITIIKASENLSAIAGKFVLFGAGILGPTILFGVYLILVVAQVDSPFMTLSKPLIPGDLPTEKVEIKLELEKSQLRAFYTKDINFGHGQNTQTVSVNAVYCGEDSWILRNPSKDRADPVLMDCQLPNENIDAANLVKLQPPKVWPELDDKQQSQPSLKYEIFGERLHLGGVAGDSALMGDNDFFWLAVILFILNYYFINVNQSSLHGFYRDRLSKLFLFGRNKNGEIIHHDDIKLSSLNNDGTVVPYHIINTTLNLRGDTSESQRGRDSDFFFFSKLYCGGTQTGYCETKLMEQQDKHLDLGTAMAISAAAAAPNMGATTIKSLVFILTLLNMRLGYWIPNPSFIIADKYISKPWAKFLWLEAIGNLKANTRLVNVSDGGHLENLAIYEMLRRRCKTIVCIDGEADPKHIFHGLITLIRIARIDLGIEIVIDLDNLRLNNGMCNEHFAVGRIIYGDKIEDGKLIYVKSSYTEGCNENPFLHKYKAEKPTFPHETTADQFFDERQFEAYRALGEAVGRDLTNRIRSQEISWPVKLVENVV